MKACFIGESPASQSYLPATKIIEAALNRARTAIPPGSGFLSERDGSRAVATAGLKSIGPSPESIE